MNRLPRIRAETHIVFLPSVSECQTKEAWRIEHREAFALII